MQTTLFDLDLFVTVKAHVTVSKARQPKQSDVDWGDIYDDYVDFNCTSQSWF